MDNNCHNITIKLSADLSKAETLAKELSDAIEKAKAVSQALADELANIEVTLE